MSGDENLGASGQLLLRVAAAVDRLPAGQRRALLDAHTPGGPPVEGPDPDLVRLAEEAVRAEVGDAALDLAPYLAALARLMPGQGG